MSGVTVIWPLIMALSQAISFVGEKENLPFNDLVPLVSVERINDEQEKLYEYYYNYNQQTRNINELKAWASGDVSFLNNILKDHGFSLKLEPFNDPRSFGVVSILDIMIEWAYKGEESIIQMPWDIYPPVSYPSVVMRDGFYIFKSPEHEYPIIGICTKPKKSGSNGDMVFMTIADKPLHGFELLDRINDIKKTIGYVENNYDYIEFPMVDFEENNKIDWLKQMKFFGLVLDYSADTNDTQRHFTFYNREEPPTYYIDQALQQTKFKMNECGAHVKSAVALGIEIVISSALEVKEVGYYIDQPFYLWIERKGVSVPLFAGYFGYDSWKKPDNLDL